MKKIAFIIWLIAAFCSILCWGYTMEDAVTGKKSTIKLYARDAKLEGGLRMQDPGEEKATIHGWNGTKQKISWNIDVKKGNYKVIMRYSEPYSGSAITVTAGKQQFAALLQPTANWQEYKAFELGILHITNAGKNEIMLQGTQLSLIKNGEGKLEHQEALPDVHWLELVPVNEEATSQTVDVLDNFKGVSLFDGKTFKGWEGNNGEETFKWFRIEDGVMVGGTMETKIPKNEFLRTDKTYQNFELRYDFKMTFPAGTDSWNAGVQFRSQKNEKIPNEMIGYQADIIPWKWGAIWDEQRRWQFLGTQLQEPPYYNDGWNKEIVRCEGPRIRIWVNGVLTLDYTEPFAESAHPEHGKIAQGGFIALQLHEDKNPVEVRYRNIQIQELK